MNRQFSACACAVLCTGANAAADTWSEVGDAGQTLSTAQMITGEPGLLTQITGNLNSGGDVDLYMICLDFPVDFSVIATSDPGGLTPILYLFDSSGMGVKYAASADPFGASWFDNLWVGPAGAYYLGVGSRDAAAVDFGGQAIWNDSTGSQFAPNGPGQNNPLQDFTFAIGGEAQGDYTLQMRGTDMFPGTPTPGTLALLAIAGLVTRRRRRS